MSDLNTDKKTINLNFLNAKARIENIEKILFSKEEQLTSTSSVEAFKNQFPRFTPMYLPTYVAGNTYVKGNIVYYNNQFYRCIVDSTENVPTDTNSWETYTDDVLNYTRDEDIQNAFLEAYVNFNPNLFGSDTYMAKLVFLYLTAHYLTMDMRNALGANQVGILLSKSVGSVSQGYTIPKWINDNASLSVYASTGYGIKYASLIRPYLIGNIMLVQGATTI